MIAIRQFNLYLRREGVQKDKRDQMVVELRHSDRWEMQKCLRRVVPNRFDRRLHEYQKLASYERCKMKLAVLKDEGGVSMRCNLLRKQAEECFGNEW